MQLVSKVLSPVIRCLIKHCVHPEMGLHMRGLHITTDNHLSDKGIGLLSVRVKLTGELRQCVRGVVCYPFYPGIHTRA